jgi:hypothetical protein
VHSGGWEITSPVSPSREVQGVVGDLHWPVLAAQVDCQSGSWPPFPADTLKVGLAVEVEEKSSMGDFIREYFACRLTIT